MDKVKILTRCAQCHGEAYLPEGEAESCTGKRLTRYLLCPQCQGSGDKAKWVGLAELAALLKEIQCSHEHTSFQGGFHFTAGEVWDDITEVCDNCGANLDKQ